VGPQPSRLRPRERLTRASDFRRAFRQGLRLDGPLFLLIARENEVGYSRLGLAVGRKVGSAVARNRAKRLLREAFRNNKPPGPRTVDLVFIPKPEIGRCGLGEVERELRDRLRRLASRRGTRAHRPAAPRVD